MAPPTTDPRQPAAVTPPNGDLIPRRKPSPRTGTKPDGTAVDTVQRLVTHAHDLGASDIHFEPQSDRLEVRVRWNATLMPLESLPLDLAPSVAGRIKTMAKLLVYRKDIPQEGWIQRGHEGIPTDLRVATYPTVFGERIALRLDTARDRPMRLEELGLPDHVHHSLLDAVQRPDGVVLMSGPSGSGKTTTLYGCLDWIAKQSHLRTVVTIEDPVERIVHGVTQTQVNPGAGLTFSRALRSVLRQDPDVILVGEVRDRETASIALEAGLTGHLVATTVHAGSAPQVFARLLEMGVEPFVLTTAVRGVISQRLLRKKCSEPDCGKSAVICMRCKGMGYVGSILVAEWLEMTPPMRDAILARGDGIALAAAAEAGGHRSLRSEALQLVEAGLTTHEEIDRVLGPEPPSS